MVFSRSGPPKCYMVSCCPETPLCLVWFHVVALNVKGGPVGQKRGLVKDHGHNTRNQRYSVTSPRVSLPVSITRLHCYTLVVSYNHSQLEMKTKPSV